MWKLREDSCFSPVYLSNMFLKPFVLREAVISDYLVAFVKDRHFWGRILDGLFQ